MATYYWVGGGGTWDNTNTANWSLTSGVVSPAGPPTSTDDVVFDSGSNLTSYTVTVGAGLTISYNNLTASAPLSGSLLIQGSGTTTNSIHGNLTLASSGVSLSTYSFSVNGSGTQTFTTNGVAIDQLTTTSTTEVSLGSALIVTNSIAIQGGGTLTTNNWNLTASGFGLGSFTTLRTYNLGTSTITLTGSSPISLSTTGSISFNASSATIICTRGPGKTINLGKINCTIGTLRNAGAGSMTFSAAATGTVTITNLENSVTPTGFIFGSGTTLGITNFNVNGTPGNLVTIASTTAGSAATLTKSSGTVSVSYLSIQDSTVTGGATWKATDSINVSGNTGWTFLSGGTGFLGFLLRT